MYLALIAMAVLGLIMVGFVGANDCTSQTYIQMLQLLMFGTIVAEHRKVQVSPSLYTLFAFPIPVATDDTHSFSQMVGVFGSPNVLAMFWSPLSMLVFSLLGPALAWR